MPSHTGSSKRAPGAGGTTPTEYQAHERERALAERKGQDEHWGPLEGKYGRPGRKKRHREREREIVDNPIERPQRKQRRPKR
jgi:hypothetical protein